jgi:translocation and assembly module TamB
MKPAARWALRGAIALGVAAVAVLIVRAWVIPAAITAQLSARLHGQAKFDNWWLGFRSAGVSGLTLREGPGADSPAWLTAERVETDLSIGSILRGRLAPATIHVRGPRLLLRFDENSDLVTKGPFGGSGSTASPPDIAVEAGQITIDQRGRPPMVVRGIAGRLHREEDVEDVELDSDDPDWGPWTVRGRFDSGFKNGAVRLASGPGFISTPERTTRVPFVPPDVWRNVAPAGPVDVAVVISLTEGAPKPLNVRTELTFRGATTALPTLGVVSEGTLGRIAVDGGLVRLDGLTGRTLSGSIAARGTLDFRGAVPRFDLELTLDKIDVARAPASWQLAEVGASGRLTGKAHLVVAMKPGEPDLTGSSGEAVIEGAVLGDIPTTSLRLAMRAQGSDLHYESKAPAGSVPAIAAGPGTAVETNPIARPGVQLPRSITTHIEFEDVEVTTLLGRLELATGIKPPVPIAGKLSVKADATIPLGHLADLKDYTIRGQGTLKAASIAGMDLGRLSTRFALVKGVLDLDDLSGQLVERPGGNAGSPPAATPSPRPDAPLVAGAFRGKLHVELSPPGKLTVRFEARELPLSELAGPFFLPPTPVGGRLSTSFDASADAARLGDPRAWSAGGRIESEQARYLDAVLDSIATRFTIDQGRLTLPDLAARLDGNPLSATLSLDLAGAQAFSGRLDVKGWAIEHVLSLIPQMPRPAPASGVVDGGAAFRGTLRPRTFTSDGRVLIRRATVESIPLGDVAATWATRGVDVEVEEISARPFSGRFVGRATIPGAAGRPARVEATFDGIRTDQLADALTRGRLRLAGTAGGRLDATVPADPKALAADLTLQAPDLTVQGVPVGRVAVSVRGKGEVIAYELTADGAAGKVRLEGDVPLRGPAPDKPANAEIRASGFGPADVARLMGIDGFPTALKGRAAIDANLRALRPDPAAIDVHGWVEARDLRWGNAFPIGDLRGILARAANAWRIDDLRGELLGGVAGGVAWGTTPSRGPRTVAFRIETDRAVLSNLLASAPWLAKRAEGFGTLRLAGQMEETLSGSAEFSVSQARLGGVTIADLRAPAEFTYHPGEGRGTLRLLQSSARIAGGRAQGSGWVRAGLDKSFALDLALADADVEGLLRIGTGDSRPGSGKIHARVALAGTDPARPRTYRGRIEMGLRDASIGDIPVIRSLDRFLGATQGGAFEAGQLRGSIADGRVLVDDLRLEGRVLQIHATGAVTFGGAVDLVVLVNTNQIIPQTGEALVALIPGLRQAFDRNEEARLRVANYLSNHLLKFRVGGTVANPNVAADRGVIVGDAAAGFFAGVLRLPLGFVK